MVYKFNQEDFLITKRQNVTVSIPETQLAKLDKHIEKINGIKRKSYLELLINKHISTLGED
jgi:metal-responsive CopG/Arc/MetJ family transcriptional regulator